MGKQFNKKSSSVYYPGDVSVVLNCAEGQAYILLYGKTGTKRQHISLEEFFDFENEIEGYSFRSIAVKSAKMRLAAIYFPDERFEVGNYSEPMKRNACVSAMAPSPLSGLPRADLYPRKQTFNWHGRPERNGVQTPCWRSYGSLVQ